MNNDVFRRREVKIVATVTVKGSDVTVDFTGTDPCMRSFKNSSFADTYSAVFVAFACLVDLSIPNSQGMFRPIRLVIPPGSVVNPDPPAPLTYSTVFPAIPDRPRLLEGARAGRARPRVGQVGGAVLSLTMAGYKDGESYILYHWAGSGGVGSIKGRDGFETLGSLDSLGRIVLPDVDLYEQVYPVQYRRGSSAPTGAGRGSSAAAPGSSTRSPSPSLASVGPPGRGVLHPVRLRDQRGPARTGGGGAC